MKTRSGRTPPEKSAKAIRGKAKGGGISKIPRERATTMIKTKKPGKDGAQKVREEKARVKELATSLKDQINGEHQAKLDREAAGRNRKSELAKNAEIVQKVTNSAKLGKTKKKLLKQPKETKPASSTPKRATRSSR